MTSTVEKSPRERLLDAASRLFYAQGYHSTGVNQLIDEAGVAKASFYQYFPSKEDLGAAYLKQEHDAWVRSMDEHLARYASRRERLLGLFDFLRERKESGGFRGCAFINAVVENPSFDAPMRRIARRHYDVVRERVGKLVDDLDAEPRTRAMSNDTLAEAIVLLFQGAIVSSQTYEEMWPIVDARNAAAQLLGS